MRLPSLPTLATLAFGIRLLIPLACLVRGDAPAALLTPDSARYLELATGLVEGRGYVTAEGPEIFRPPGYPLLLAFGVWLGAPVTSVIVIQALLGAWCCAVVHRAARELTGDERGARAAAAWVAFDPVLVAWAARVMAETGLAAGLAAAVLGIVRMYGGDRRRGLGWLAAGVACAACFKPIAALLPLALGALVFAFPPAAEGTRRRRLVDAVLVTALPALLLVPWVVRNGLVLDFWGFSSQFDRILAFTAPAAVQARRERRPFSEVRAEINLRQQPPGYEAGGYAEARREGAARLLAGAMTYAEVHAAGMARVLLSPGAQPLHEPFRSTDDVSRVVLDQGSARGASHMAATRPGLWLTEWLLVPPLFALLGSALVGAWRGAGSRAARRCLAGTALAVLVFSGGPWGQSRFRAPLVPLLAVLAGCALARGARESGVASV